MSFLLISEFLVQPYWLDQRLLFVSLRHDVGCSLKELKETFASSPIFISLWVESYTKTHDIVTNVCIKTEKVTGDPVRMLFRRGTSCF